MAAGALAAGRIGGTTAAICQGKEWHWGGGCVCCRFQTDKQTIRAILLQGCARYHLTRFHETKVQSLKGAVNCRNLLPFSSATIFRCNKLIIMRLWISSVRHTSVTLWLHLEKCQ